MYVAIWVGALVLTYKLFGSPLALWQRVATERPGPVDASWTARVLHAGHVGGHDDLSLRCHADATDDDPLLQPPSPIER